MMLVRISSAKVSADRILEVMNTESEIVSKNNAAVIPADERMGRIEFKNVSFSYGSESELALDNVSFSIEPGQKVAVIGATGSGKSSLVALIPRLYDTTSGSVLVGGVDVRDHDLDSLRRSIGIVLQETILFTGTIRDNIRYGKPDATDEEVIAAAKAAQAHDFISQLPSGYDTMLGQRGVNLSGGQKQRLAIARALILQPPILILDDSTSALDMGTESRLQRALAELMRGRTSILIAQRISSVMDADKIFVMDQGRLVDSGTHAELLASSKIYQEIYESQLGKEEVSYG
jgi:ATP-binding cassette subfamily B protein